MMLTWDAYHGTDESAKEKILSTGHFIESTSDTEWAGSGVYFFIELTPFNNAQKWARYIRHFPHPSVIKAKIEVDNSKVFDLSLSSSQGSFHRLRTLYFKTAKELAEQHGREIDAVALDRMKLDCFIINQICEKFDYYAVKRACYIHFYSHGMWEQYPRSNIPNSIIICIRNPNCIVSIQRDMRYNDYD